MTRAALSMIAQDGAGNALNGASVTIRRGVTSASPLADVYNARTGGSPIANPVSTGADGTRTVYLERGKTYRIEGLGPSGSGVDIWDAPFSDSTPILGPNGSAEAPAISFAGDGDTGIYRSAANHLSFSEGGVDRGRIYGRRNIVGTVSQSDGVPTGAVIEAGSNANGRFTRFASGLQICTFITPNVVADNAIGSIWRTAGADAVSWSYPAAFAEPPIVAGSAGSQARWLLAGEPTALQTVLRAGSPTNDATPNPLTVVAVGAWVL